MTNEEIVRAILASRFQAGHSRTVAALTRRFGPRNLDLAENAAQDAHVRALQRWPEDGTPDDPERWLARVAHNCMVDALRRERATEPLDHEDAMSMAVPEAAVNEDEIRLLFLACDPSLTRAAQIALVLNVAFGLTARQIAKAFVSDERAISQRLVRAKQRLRDRGTHFDLPAVDALPHRLNTILEVLYVVFSEGYDPTEGAAPLEGSLCSEALRLVRLLTASAKTALPVTFALQAVMCFHASRLPARLSDDGGLLLLQEQDRTQWDRNLIAEAFDCLGRAGLGMEATRFHLEAGIAACHAVAPRFADTDWVRVVRLYDALRRRAPSLVVDVNRALAVAMAYGARAGLDELDAIPERNVMTQYPFALAAYADLHLSLGEVPEAARNLDLAIAHQPATAQLALLRRKRAAVEACTNDGLSSA